MRNAVRGVGVLTCNRGKGLAIKCGNLQLATVIRYGNLKSGAEICNRGEGWQVHRYNGKSRLRGGNRRIWGWCSGLKSGAKICSRWRLENSTVRRAELEICAATFN